MAQEDLGQWVSCPATDCFVTPSALLAQTSTLAATPPMGWNSWNLFAGRVTDRFRAAADAMVSSGMKDAGYVYVNIDDTWEGERDAQGNIRPTANFRHEGAG